MAIDTNEQNFQKTVVDRSFQVPVVLDFWAAWCAPCKMLGPVLEKLEKDYKGAFDLVKVDTEANQNLASMFQITSIPDVKIVKDGKIIDQFQGALPENEIRKILNKHIQVAVSEDSWEGMAANKPMEFLQKLLETKFRDQPEERDSLLWQAYIKHTSAKGSLEDIIKIVESIEEENRSFENQRRVTLQFLSKGEEARTDLLRLTTNEKLDVLEKYLEIVETSKGDSQDRAKDDLIACFYFLPAQDEVVNEYRRKLSRLLF